MILRVSLTPVWAALSRKRPFGVGNGHSVKLVEAAGVEVGHAVIGSDITECLAIGGKYNCLGVVDGELLPRGQSDAEPCDAVNRTSGPILQFAEQEGNGDE
jgi:hypothetical protein